MLRRRVCKHAHWREVASILEARLQAMPKSSSPQFSDYYQRGKLLNWLLNACERAKWMERIIPRLEAEADACQCYSRLAAGERERVRQCCVRGYKRTLKDAPGIASALQKHLRAMAHEEQRYGLAARAG